jgi:hypothetical protein
LEKLLFSFCSSEELELLFDLLPAVDDELLLDCRIKSTDIRYELQLLHDVLNKEFFAPQWLQLIISPS